jgi:GNAT superfamily N-acetyltransferase
VNKNFRNRGFSTRLINAAKEFVQQNGGKILEAYPVEPKKGRTADVFVYTGLASAFRKAGFTEVARRSETRPIMRFYL